MIDRERGKELERELRAHLEPGEQVLWSGQPPQAFFLRRNGSLPHFSLTVGGGLMTVIGGFLLPASLLAPERLAAQGGWMLVVAVPLTFLLGLHLLAGRFIYDAARRRCTLYALTDRRFLILSGLLWRFCRSRALSDIVAIFRREDRHGRTTIWLDSWPLLQLLRRRFSFGPAPSVADFQAFPVPRISGLYSIRFGWFGFELIEDGDDVAALIKDAHEKARSRW